MNNDNNNLVRQKLSILVSEINDTNCCGFKDAKIVDENIQGAKNENRKSTIIVRDAFFDNEYRILSKKEQNLYLLLSLDHAKRISSTLIKRIIRSHEVQDNPQQLISVLSFLKVEVYES